MGRDKKEYARMTKSRYLILDSFEGAVSDFADETVVDAYETREAAICEVVKRVRMLAKCHEEGFAANTMPQFPSDDEMLSSLREGGKLKYVSADGCKYTWQIIANPK